MTQTIVLSPQAIDLLDLAKLEPKGDYRRYNLYKRKLEYLSLNPMQYEVVHRKLIGILEV